MENKIPVDDGMLAYTNVATALPEHYNYATLVETCDYYGTDVVEYTLNSAKALLNEQI